MSKTESFVEVLADLKEEEAIRIAKERLEAGEDPLKLVEDCREAMKIVGKRFEEGTYFIADLIMAGEILKKITEMIKPKLKKAGVKYLGKVVIGTVEGDIHDIGKNIVISMLEANGFEVIDLGVDVPPQKFVEAIRKFNPQVVGMSGLLTLAFDSMKRTVEAIKEAGLRDKVKIIIGGGTVDEKVKEYVGADAYGRDPVIAVSLAKKWVGGE